MRQKPFYFKRFLGLVLSAVMALTPADAYAAAVERAENVAKAEEKNFPSSESKETPENPAEDQDAATDGKTEAPSEPADHPAENIPSDCGEDEDVDEDSEPADLSGEYKESDPTDSPEEDTSSVSGNNSDTDGNPDQEEDTAETALSEAAAPDDLEEAEAMGIEAVYHTQEEIIAYLSQSGATKLKSVQYAEQPEVTAPYRAGALSETTLNSAVAMLNQIRYIAGLPEVTLADSYNQLSQTAALVNYSNGYTSHTPKQPEGMEDALFQLGYQGASHSNLATGYKTLNEALIDGWLADSDDKNISVVGHRRWALNPGMKETGFGAVGNYYAMYAHSPGSGHRVFGVSWPAQNMPVDYFDRQTAWSVSLGEGLNSSEIGVKLTRTRDGKVWNFSNNASDGYFNVDNHRVGSGDCIIFRPNLSDIKSYEDGDTFHVEITRNGASYVDYNVRFFDLPEETDPAKIIDGETFNGISWSLDNGGKLVITGSGDYTGDSENTFQSCPWSVSPINELTRSVTVTVSGMTSTSQMFSGFRHLTSVDLSHLDTSRVTDMSSMFSNCTSLTNVDLSHLDTSRVTDMSSMFSNCTSLTNVDLSYLDTGRVTDMSSMFSDCWSLTNIDFGYSNTSQVTSMNSMFYNCHSLTNVNFRYFDTGQVTDMNSMFFACSKLTDLDLSSFDTSHVTDMGMMFRGCGSLKSLDLSSFETGSVAKMHCMFEDCSGLTSLELGSFNTAGVKSMACMFSDCVHLEKLDLCHFHTDNVTSMNGMFSNCRLKELDLSRFRTGSLTDTTDMFKGCGFLTSLDLTHFDTAKVKTMVSMFEGCHNLTDLELGSFNTGQVINMRSMFKDCRTLNSLDLSSFETGNVKNMDSMFEGCWALKSLDLSGFDTSQVTGMNSLFKFCGKLESLDLSSFDMGNITDKQMVGAYFLGGCSNLSYLLTPKNCMQKIPLPGVSSNTDKWYDDNGTEYSHLPTNMEHCIVLHKNDYQGSGKQVLVVSGIRMKSKIYDGAPDSYTGTAVVTDSSGNPIPNAVLTYAYSGTFADGSMYAETTNAPSQAGYYKLSFKIEGIDTEPYHLRNTAYRFHILRKDVTLTAESVSVETGGQLPEWSALKYTVSGLLGNDELIKKPSFKYSADNFSTAKKGSCEIIPYDADAGNNYNIHYVNGTLTVYPAGERPVPEPKPDPEPESGDVLPEDMPDDGVIPEGLWMAGIEENGYAYTGKAVKPQVRIYDHKTLLKEKKDYTLAYTRNIKAYPYTSADSAYDVRKAPTITVKGKGNYTGKETQTFRILPLNIGVDSGTDGEQTDGNMFAADDISVACRTDRTQKPVPVLMWNDTKLKNKKDYTVAYYDSTGINRLDSVKDIGDYYLEMTGKGNFTGTRRIKLVVTNHLKLISRTTVAKIGAQPCTGSAVTPALIVRDGKTELTAGTHYTVSYSRNTAPGKAYAVITGIESAGYSGTKRVSFRILGTPMNKVTVTGPGNRNYVYEGTKIEPQFRLSFRETTDDAETVRTLTPGIDYKITWHKNQNAGTATVMFMGTGRYTGTLKKTFRIAPYDIAADEDSRFAAVLPQESVPYAKGGAAPKVTVTFRDSSGYVQTLTEGTDYTLSYQNHTAVNDGSQADIRPTVTVKGKGNFSGTRRYAYIITSQNIGQLTLTAQDKLYRNKGNIYATKVTIRDLNGRLLKAGTDYNKTFTYTYKNETPVNDGTMVRSAGEIVDAGDIIPAGTVLQVEAEARNGSNYTGTVKGEYCITQESIASASVSVPKQIYTGRPVTLDKNQITVRVKKEVVDISQYEILPDSYVNNRKKGTASVTIKGIGNYGGTRTVKFTIRPKGFLWWIK